MSEYVISFSLFVILQALAINGIKICFQEGMIFYKLGEWLKREVKNKMFLKPVMLCCQCMASTYGTVTFFSVVIPVFGFKWQEVGVCIFDIFILVSLNGYIYKNI